MTKKLCIVLVTALSLALFSGCLGSGPAPAESGTPESESSASGSSREEAPGEILTARMGTSTQTTMPACAAAEKFCKDVAEKSGGRIAIDFFPARQLGDDKELMEQVMNGTLETALISSSTFSAYTPLLDTLQVPFLLNTYDKEYAALTSPEGEALYTGMDELGFKTLAVYEYGIRHLANNVRPIEKPEDLRGLKVRVVPSNLILDAINAMGGNPTPMAYGEVYTALQTKVVDGEEINFTSIASEKHYEVLKYVSEIGLWPFPGALVVNTDFYNKLSPEDQKMFKETALECLEYNMGLMAKAEDESRRLITESGGAVNQIDDAAPFVEATRAVREEFAKKDPRIAAFIEMAEKLE